MLHTDISRGLGMRGLCPWLGAVISKSPESHRVRRVGWGRGGGCRGRRATSGVGPILSRLCVVASQRAVLLPRPTPVSLSALPQRPESHTFAQINQKNKPRCHGITKQTQPFHVGRKAFKMSSGIHPAPNRAHGFF